MFSFSFFASKKINFQGFFKEKYHFILTIYLVDLIYNLTAHFSSCLRLRIKCRLILLVIKKMHQDIFSDKFYLTKIIPLVNRYKL